MIPNVTFRFAAEKDVPLILRFIRELADYEGLLQEVVATESLLHQWLFVQKKAEVLFCMQSEMEVGFALFFHNFSTFLGRAGLYLEDLYIAPPYRRQGLGREMFRQLARIGAERGCGRLEWWCLDENTNGIKFYQSLGAEAMCDWTVYRLSPQSLQKLADDSHCHEA